MLDTRACVGLEVSYSSLGPLLLKRSQSQSADLVEYSPSPVPLGKLRTLPSNSWQNALQMVQDALKLAEPQARLIGGTRNVFAVNPFLVVTTHPRVTLRPYPQVCMHVLDFWNAWRHKCLSAKNTPKLLETVFSRMLSARCVLLMLDLICRTSNWMPAIKLTWHYTVHLQPRPWLDCWTCGFDNMPSVDCRLASSSQSRARTPTASAKASATGLHLRHRGQPSTREQKPILDQIQSHSYTPRLHG